FFLLIFAFVIATACSKKDDVEPSLIPKGNFGRANQLAFYLYDEKGSNLVEKYGWRSITLEYLDGKDSKDIDYSEDINQLEDEQGETYINIFIRGFDSSLSSSFNLLIPEHQKDRVDIKWWLTNKDVIGGKYYAHIESLKYNGKLVYSETDKKNWPNKVVIIKGKDKTTVVR